LTEPDFQIRQAVPSDLADLVDLEQACFAIPWLEESLRHDLEENQAARYQVALLPDGSLAGYAACWAVLDEGQITNIAVAPPWRRRGVGRQLLNALVRQAQTEGLRLLSLEVRANNAAAQNLYKACGFEPAGLRRGYYADTGEDAIIMLKRIR
jgi:ribosomal-protein-alanine N-acetyltransferase